MDSAIEIVASLVVVWELTGMAGERQRVALRLIGLNQDVTGHIANARVQGIVTLKRLASPASARVGFETGGVIIEEGDSSVSRDEFITPLDTSHRPRTWRLHPCAQFGECAAPPRGPLWGTRPPPWEPSGE